MRFRSCFEKIIAVLERGTSSGCSYRVKTSLGGSSGSKWQTPKLILGTVEQGGPPTLPLKNTDTSVILLAVCQFVFAQFANSTGCRFCRHCGE